MREILFRGKNAKGEWEYGVPLITGLNSEIAYITQANSYDCRVDIETVGQYTGLTDKNGKKIFEGDIIDIQYPDTFVANAVVEYVGASFVASTDYDSWELDEFVSLEVIGNIHDNPELLKGE